MNNANYLSDESFYVNDFHRKIAQIRTIKEGATSKSSVSTNVGRPSAAWGIIRFRPDGKSSTWNHLFGGRPNQAPPQKNYNSETGLLNEKELKETIRFVSECKYTKFLALCQDPLPVKRH
jgi:hypothetical protein